MRIAQVITAKSWGDVTPEALERGIGGREGSLIRLAREWARQGHEVTNFVPVENAIRHSEEVAPGALSSGYHEYVPVEGARLILGCFKYDAVIAWECPSVFADDHVRKLQDIRLVEMQCAHFAEGQRQHAEAFSTGVVALSPWHRDFMLHDGLEMDPSLVHVLPNCVDLTFYPQPLLDDEAIERRRLGPKRFFYSSSPDRGLWGLLKTWPRIRGMYEEAELTVAYGVKDWCSNLRWAHFSQGEMAVEIEHLMRQPGIIDVGVIGQAQLARIQREATALLYPCDTIQPTETGCLVAGTMVDCPRDHAIHPDGIPIEQLKKGKLVWSFNESKRLFELKRVTRAWKTRTNAPILKLTLDDGTVIRGTDEHPFLLRDGSWKPMGELLPGDSLMALYRDVEPKVRIDPDRHRYYDEYELVADAKFDERAGMHVHHADERHSNVGEDNLDLMTPAEHHRHHDQLNKGFRKWWDGLTEDELAKQRELKRQAALARWGREIRADGSIARSEHGQNHKVLFVEPDGFEDVYNLEVEDNHNYVAGGVVVHNCITAMEAMAAGCPVVTTDCDCMGEEFGEVAAIAPLPYTADKYVHRLAYTLENPAEYARLVRAGRTFVEQERQWKDVAGRWIELFEQLTP